MTDRAWPPGEVRVSRVRVSSINSVSGARHRERQRACPKPGLNTWDIIV